MGDTHFNEQLRERTMKMAVDVRNLLKSEKIIPIDRPFVNQLIRSSSSVAANYRSATRGRSDAEFYSKICIVMEETDETLFWIDYMLKLKVLNETEAMKIRDEVEQLVRLFSSIKRKMKEKIWGEIGKYEMRGLESEVLSPNCKVRSISDFAPHILHLNK